MCIEILHGQKFYMVTHICTTLSYMMHTCLTAHMSGHSIDSYVYKYMYIYVYIYILIHTHHLNTLEKCVLVLEMQYDSKKHI